MRVCLFAVSTVFLPAPMAFAAGDFDGSRPLVCHPLEINDCLPGTDLQTRDAERGDFL